MKILGIIQLELRKLISIVLIALRGIYFITVSNKMTGTDKYVCIHVRGTKQTTGNNAT